MWIQISPSRGEETYLTAVVTCSQRAEGQEVKPTLTSGWPRASTSKWDAPVISRNSTTTTTEKHAWTVNYTAKSKHSSNIPHPKPQSFSPRAWCHQSFNHISTQITKSLFSFHFRQFEYISNSYLCFFIMSKHHKWRVKSFAWLKSVSLSWITDRLRAFSGNPQ